MKRMRSIRGVLLVPLLRQPTERSEGRVAIENAQCSNGRPVPLLRQRTERSEG